MYIYVYGEQNMVLVFVCIYIYVRVCTYLIIIPRIGHEAIRRCS